ncbi:hypothetical protein HN51_023723 [Arachis hypogaea]
MLSRMRVLRSKRVGEFLLSFRRHRFLCTNLNPPAAASSLRIGSFLKYAAVSALTGSTAFTAYVSYAYSLDEIEEKTKSIRESAKYATASGAGDNGCTTLGKFQHKLYSTAISVPTKAIELYLEKRTLIEGIIRSYTEPWKDKLLPDLSPDEGKHVYTLVLDLDETLIYYELVNGCWEAVKRPGVVDFLEHLSRLYEIVVYTDEENQGHVEAVINKLHPTKRCIIYSLSRVATKYQDGKHFRDLSKLNRDPAKVIYLSGHALENCLQPENCVPMKPCKGFDKDDTTLLDFIPFLKCVARQRPTDIRPILQSYRGCDIPTEFIKRNKRSKEDKSHIQNSPPSAPRNLFFVQSSTVTAINSSQRCRTVRQQPSRFASLSRPSAAASVACCHRAPLKTHPPVKPTPPPDCASTHAAAEVYLRPIAVRLVSPQQAPIPASRPSPVAHRRFLLRGGVPSCNLSFLRRQCCNKR